MGEAIAILLRDYIQHTAIRKYTSSVELTNYN